MIFPANHLTRTKTSLFNQSPNSSKTKYNYNQVTTQKPKQQLMKTTNTTKTKSKETNAWFRSPFMLSSQETNWAYNEGYSTAAKILMGRQTGEFPLKSPLV